MNIDISFTRTPIVIPPQSLPSREIGAVVEFNGIVRETEGAGAISALDYEAYEPMAVRQLEGHLWELNALHPCSAVTLVHRLGRVAVGEASLYVRVAAKHRGPALALCGALIDRMKDDVPIWKR